MRQGRFIAGLGVTVGVMCLGLASVAWADRPGCHGDGSAMIRKASHGLHGHGMAGHLLRHLLRHKQDLALTDEQIGKLRAMALDYDRARIRGEAEVMVAERELRALLWDEAADMTAIEAKVKEREALEAATRIIGIKERRSLIAVLTSDQRTKLKTLWEQRRHGHQHAVQGTEGAETAEADHATEDAIQEIEFGQAGGGASAG
jgi:periplasmic protein CpxP/Spy